MKVRSKVLKARTAALLTGTMALIIGSASGAWAADLKPILKAPPPAADQGWYFTGEIEAGGRAFIERPPSGFGYNSSGNFLLPTQTDSRAKFEQYGKVPPGLFLDWFYLEAGSKDGRYNVDVWGKDVGVNAQSFGFDFAQNGFQYLTFGWDQTPHLYSTSAKSLFSGIGTTNLTVTSVQTGPSRLAGHIGTARRAPTLGPGLKVLTRVSTSTVSLKAMPLISTRSAPDAIHSAPATGSRRRRIGTSTSLTHTRIVPEPSRERWIILRPEHGLPNGGGFPSNVIAFRFRSTKPLKSPKLRVNMSGRVLGAATASSSAMPDRSIPTT